MMRNIRTLMIALALFLGATTMLTAQVKIAHIDVQKLLEEMPERKSIESQLKKMEQGYMNDIQAAIKELQAKAQKYQNEAAALTEAQLKAREAEFLKKSEEIKTMEENIRKTQQTAAENLQKKQQELVEPLLKKVKSSMFSLSPMTFPILINIFSYEKCSLSEHFFLFLQLKKALF